MNRFLLLIFCFAVLLATGCELYTQDSYQEHYVVESYLVAGRNLPPVRVSHTLPVDEKYVFEEAAVNNASVKIYLLNNGDIEKTYNYALNSTGIYKPIDSEKVLPERRYKLEVTFSDNNDVVTAQTLVPGSFHVTDEVVDSAIYQSTEEVEIITTRSNYPGRQAFYIFTVNVVNPAKERLTPFYLEQVEEDDDIDITNFYVNDSGILNEQTFEINPDGTVTLWLPWLSVAFYGENDITANAIDDNMYDFLRSQSVQGGSSTLSPGQIPNIKYNVEGGIGVFGSLASDTVRIFIKRQ